MHPVENHLTTRNIWKKSYNITLTIDGPKLALWVSFSARHFVGAAYRKGFQMRYYREWLIERTRLFLWAHDTEVVVGVDGYCGGIFLRI